MVENLIETTVSPKQIKFKPGSTPAWFEVTVVNESNRFASFQLEVTAAGADPNQVFDWYRISPEVSTKKPPGDETKFKVTILDAPVPGFVGRMQLTVRVFSMELRDEDRDIVILILEKGTGSIPLTLELPVRDFQEYPENPVTIPLRVYNPGQIATNITLELIGLERSWLIEGERQLELPPNGQSLENFVCQIPDISEAISKVYPFKIKATHTNGPPSWVEGTIEVLPIGVVEFNSNPIKHQIPAKRAWLPNWRNKPVTYELQFDNQSNLHQQVNIEIQDNEKKKCTWELSEPQTEIIPGKISSLALEVKTKRPWFGRVKKISLEAEATLSDLRLGNTKPASQILKLHVFPIIPLWLLIAGGLGLIWLVWFLSGLNPNNPLYGHKDAVNSVQFNGNSNNVISGSNDQTLIQWRTNGFVRPFLNPEIGEIANTSKAVRVIRYKPVDNNIVAAGLENGEIQLFNLLGETTSKIDSLVSGKDDRVLALEFTDDSRFLFSGHGSGFVIGWDVRQNLDNPVAGQRKQPIGRKFDFAVYGLKFIGSDNQNLAIAGRFNQLVVWNLVNNSLLKVPYREGGQDDYIFSIDTAQLRPYLLATGDKQGYITLWNMRKCLVDKQPCEIIDQWSNGHGTKPVRSVALSNGGCYLASAGDDGRMMLWPLTKEGARSEKFLTGKEIARSLSGKTINSIDINVLEDRIYIVSGSDDTQVRAKRMPRMQDLGCDASWQAKPLQ